MTLRQHIFFWLCMLLVLGLFMMDLARALPSISMIGVVLLGISYLIRKDAPSTLGNKPDYLVLTGTFVVLLPSVFYSDNTAYLFEKWQVALPFLVLPPAFMLIPQMPARRYALLYEFYFILVLITAVVAFLYYLFHQQEINALYLASKVMPTFPVSHHPTLSVMIAFAIFIAYRLFISGHRFRYRFEHYLFPAGGIFLFIFIHVFSVRSGLLALYVLIVVELASIAIRQKRVKTAILTAAILVVVGGTTLLLSPTFSNKLTNTTQDLEAVKNNHSANNKSLASRMISYRNAIRITRESSWLFGCGLGDISDLNVAIFKRDYPEVTRTIIPHNQFLFYLAAIGITGVLVFLFCFLYPLLVNKNYTNVILMAHYIAMLVYFQVEAPIETQVGVAYAIIFILIPLHSMQKSAV